MIKDEEDLAWEAAFAATTEREQIERRFPYCRHYRGVGSEYLAAAMSREMTRWDKACELTQARIDREAA